MASSRPDQSVNAEVLEISHHQTFERALIRVLPTEAAELAFAEIIDGLPTKPSYAKFHWMQDDHPATFHEELCPGVLEKVRKFRSTFTLTSLSFQLSVSSFTVQLLLSLSSDILPQLLHQSSFDWPEMNDDFYLIDAMHEHYEGMTVDKDKIRAALERLKITQSSPIWDHEARHKWTKEVNRQICFFLVLLAS